MRNSSIFFWAVFCLILSSNASGQQWQQTASSPKGSGITDLVVKQSNGYLFATTGSFNWPNADTGGVHRSTDGGDTWTRVFPAYIARMIAVKQDSILFASVWPTPAQTEGLYYSTNNGNTWTLTWNAGPANNVFAVAFDSATQYAYAGSRLGIARNTFGGTTGDWSIISNLPFGAWVLDIALDKRFANRNYVYVAAQHPFNPSANGVYYSTNQGSVFTRILGIPVGDTVVSIIVVNDTLIGTLNVQALYAGTSNGKVYKARIIGTTYTFSIVYTAVGSSRINAFAAIDLASSNSMRGLAAYLWAVAEGFPFAGSAVDSGGVYQSSDQGRSWQSRNVGLPPPLRMSAVAPYIPTSGSPILYSGKFLNQNNGGPVYKLDILTDVRLTTEGIPDGFMLHQNYPNPFNPKTKIRFSIGIPSGQIPKSNHTTLKVFDLLGREVRTLVNEELKPGSYETTFDAGALASGVYFYRLSAGEFQRTNKLVVLR